MSEQKQRGPNLTSKSEMHIGRNWSQGSWDQAMESLSKKWNRESYAKRNDGGGRKRPNLLEEAPRVEKIEKKQPVVEYK